MKLLSIGNSFSNNAHRYLHRLAKQEGVYIKTANLVIGGCNLRTHYLNMLDDASAYLYEFNGELTGLKVSIRQALESDEWDVITLQQASMKSPFIESYTPYIEQLCAYVKRYCPHAKIMLHQTWAYEHESPTLKTRFPEMTADEMLLKVKEAYLQAAELINADGIIPCGEAMMAAAKAGEYKLHSDGAHASAGIGKYVLALTWFKTLTGKDITNNAFSEFDVTVTEEERRIAINAVNAVVK